jgi:hypothetical protein
MVGVALSLPIMAVVAAALVALPAFLALTIAEPSPVFLVSRTLRPIARRGRSTASLTQKEMEHCAVDRAR